MTLQQLANIKRWHGTHHPLRGSLELQLWDAMLTCWVMGWMSVPPAIVLGPSWMAMTLCGMLVLAPGAYVALRLRLHRRGVLRCDWASSTRSP